MATTELALLVAPISSPIYRVITAISPSRLPFQWIAFLREQWIVGSLAITQLYPLLYPATSSPSSDSDDIVKSLIGIDAKDAEEMRITLQRTVRLANELEISNVRTFDKRRRLLTGEDSAADPAVKDRARAKEGERLIRVLRREMENRAHGLELAYACITLTNPLARRHDSRNNLAVSGRCSAMGKSTKHDNAIIVIGSIFLYHIWLYLCEISPHHPITFTYAAGANRLRMALMAYKGKLLMATMIPTLMKKRRDSTNERSRSKECQPGSAL